jgi:hypothetical protein
MKIPTTAAKIALKVKPQQKGELSALFTNQRFLTKGIEAEISPITQLLLWEMIDERRAEDVELDYLQIFQLEPSGFQQKIIHSQEQPPHEHNTFLLGPPPITAKIYVIDDGSHSTMMLAEEY